MKPIISWTYYSSAKIYSKNGQYYSLHILCPNDDAACNIIFTTFSNFWFLRFVLMCYLQLTISWHLWPAIINQQIILPPSKPFLIFETVPKMKSWNTLHHINQNFEKINVKNLETWNAWNEVNYICYIIYFIIARIISLTIISIFLLKINL